MQMKIKVVCMFHWKNISLSISIKDKKLFFSFFLSPFFWAAAPKGPMTYAFTHRGNFSFFSFSVRPPP